VRLQRRNVLIGAAAAAVAVVVAVGLLHQSTPDEKPGLTPGFRVYTPPKLGGSTLAGGTVTLAALRGKPTFLNFWQSYCTPCQTEAPQLKAFAQTLHGRANLVGVDVQDRRHAALAFVRRYEWRYPQLPVSDLDLVERFGVVGFPTTIILDARGRVVDKIVGQTTEKALALKLRAVDQLAA
jgi:thiol-disulfide isomerase/thioredoxin